jgi:hypothetical protein
VRNRIIKLNQPDGSECTTIDELQEMTVDFYHNLFQSEGTSNMRMVLDCVPKKMTDEMNHILNIPFDENEVKNALFQMFPTKAPGPDVFSLDYVGELHIIILRRKRGKDPQITIHAIHNLHLRMC